MFESCKYTDKREVVEKWWDTLLEQMKRYFYHSFEDYTKRYGNESVNSQIERLYDLLQTLPQHKKD